MALRAVVVGGGIGGTAGPGGVRGTAAGADSTRPAWLAAERAGYDSSGSELTDRRWIYEYDAWAEAAAIA